MFRKNERYKILTSDGFKFFDGLQKIRKKNMIFITMDNGEDLKCSVDHKILTTNGFKEASVLSIGDYIKSISGNIKIINIELIDGVFDFYDPVNVENNIYISNNIISHNCDFLGSTNTVIDPTVLRFLLSLNVDPIKIDMNNRLRVFEEPENGALYVAGVDCAKGTGENNSTIQMLKIESLNPIKMKQVCVFEDNKTNVYDFANIINRLTYYYNKAYIMVENNGEGSAVVQRLWWDYENENLVNSGSKEQNLGIRSTRTTKPKAVLLMKKLIEDGSLEIIDVPTIEELGSFIEENDKFFGKDKPDDLVCALFWGCFIIEMNILDESYSFKKEKEDVDAWGVLSNIDPNFEEDWSWLYDKNFTD
jgi:hypothetical protein